MLHLQTLLSIVELADSLLTAIYIDSYLFHFCFTFVSYLTIETHCFILLSRPVRFPANCNLHCFRASLKIELSKDSTHSKYIDTYFFSILIHHHIQFFCHSYRWSCGCCCCLFWLCYNL